MVRTFVDYEETIWPKLCQIHTDKKSLFKLQLLILTQRDQRAFLPLTL